MVEQPTLKRRPSPIQEIEVGGIAVPTDRPRELHQDVIDELAHSITQRGLLQPIVVRANGEIGDGNGYRLIAGRHRLEAVKKLGWSRIEARILKADLDETEAELAEIDENLIRADLSPAERAIHVNRRKELYEQLHPETKDGGSGRGRPKVRQNGEAKERFTKTTAEKTSKSERSIQRDAERGKKGRDWLAKIVGTSLDAGAEIDALIDLPTDVRDQLITRAVKGAKVSAKAERKKINRDKREPEKSHIPRSARLGAVIDPDEEADAQPQPSKDAMGLIDLIVSVNPDEVADLLKGECSQDRDTVVKKLRGILDLLEHDDALDRGCVRRALTEGDGDVA